jgi:hypothetical protein
VLLFKPVPQRQMFFYTQKKLLNWPFDEIASKNLFLQLPNISPLRLANIFDLNYN